MSCAYHAKVCLPCNRELFVYSKWNMYTCLLWIMVDEIIMTTINCQGLGGRYKRKDVLNYLKKKQYMIYCLQDTHFSKSDEKVIRTQWGYECYFSSYNTQARGVAILLNNNFEYNLHNVIKDENGNLLILDITLKNKRFSLINIYGPNKDTPTFFEEIRKYMSESVHESAILMGDYNLVLDPQIDTKNYWYINNPKAREKVLDMCAEFNLVDVWRVFNNDKAEYTWRTKSCSKQARLDFILVSENLITDIDYVNIEYGYRSDHSMVTLATKGAKLEKAKPFWKFNNSLLSDREYVNVVKSVISQVKEQYRIEDENECVIDDQLFLEVLLMEIRGKTISYSSYIKKKRDNKESNLIADINNLERNEASHVEILSVKRKELEEIRKIKLEGNNIRSRSKWMEQGEKVTKYFCNLEKRNYVCKAMPNLYKSDGTKTTNENEIRCHVKEFYKKLYTLKWTWNWIFSIAAFRKS